MASRSQQQSLLAQAIARGLVELVGINEVRLMLFERPAEGRPVSLGVKGLSACSVVILASDHGAILAHIGPNELGAQDQRSYLRLAGEKMDELESLFHENQRYFGAGSHAYLIFATFQDTPVSPEQTAIFKARLQSLQVPLVSDRPYERSISTLIDDDRPEGTMWIVKRRDTRPIVYLEDRLVSPIVPTVSVGSPAQLHPSQSDPSQAGPSHIIQQHEESQWMRRQGQADYILVSESGQVLQLSSSPPQRVWVYLYNQDGSYKGAAMLDGTTWDYA